MIMGIGSDIVDIARIKRFVDTKTARQLSRVFTKQEYNYAMSSQNIYERLAVRFAAKEAFFKAFGYGILSEIEIQNDESAQPHIVLHGSTKQHWEQQQKPDVFVTLSHSSQFGTAFVVIQKK